MNETEARVATNYFRFMTDSCLLDDMSQLREKLAHANADVCSLSIVAYSFAGIYLYPPTVRAMQVM